LPGKVPQLVGENLILAAGDSDKIPLLIHNVLMLIQPVNYPKGVF